MLREEFYRGESPKLDLGQLESDETKIVPLTFNDVELLVSDLATLIKIEPDDMMRQAMAGYFHHLPMGECTFKVGDLIKYMVRHISNGATYHYSEEARKREQESSKVLSLAKDADEKDETESEPTAVS